MADTPTPVTTTSTTTTVSAPVPTPPFWAAAIRLWRSSRVWTAILGMLGTVVSELAGNYQAYGISPTTGHVLGILSAMLAKSVIDSTAREDAALKTSLPPPQVAAPIPDTTKTTTVTVAPGNPTPGERAVS